MSAAPTISRHTIDATVVKSLLWRAGLVIVATVAVAIELPAWVRAPLVVLAALATIFFVLPRAGRRGPLERLVTSIGAAVVVLALLGLVLNFIPIGLSAAGWGIGVGVVELAIMVGFAFVAPIHPPSAARLPRIPKGQIVWGIAAAAVLAGALVWSVGSFAGTHGAPLALSGVPSGNSLKVTVSTGTAAGTYDLIRVTSTGHSVLASGIDVAPGVSQLVTVTVRADERDKIELVKPGSLTPLRTLILDTRGSVTKVAP